jgi:hypothetical protein
MNNFKNRLNEFAIHFGKYVRGRHYMREGQYLFNSLHTFDPTFADEIRGTDLDPFYDDAIIPATWDAIVARYNSDTGTNP